MLTVSLDTKAFTATMTELEKNQLPFAISKGLNSLAIQAADAQRTEMRKHFTIRNEGVLKFGIVRTKQATKTDLSTEVGVSRQATGSREAFGYLNKFEQGIRKTPIQGSTVSVPTDHVRRSKRGVVTPAMRIKALGFKQVGKVIAGAKNTFIIKSKTGRSAGVILQRVRNTKKSRMGPHQAGHDPGLRVLYVLERSVPIKPILRLGETMVRTAREKWPTVFAEAWAFALKTARR
jgi:hypothetical protein